MFLNLGHFMQGIHLVDIFPLRSLTICCTVASNTPHLPPTWHDLNPTFLKSNWLVLWNDAVFALCSASPATHVVVISFWKTSEGQRPCAEQQSRVPHQFLSSYSVLTPPLWFQGIFCSLNTVKTFSILRIDNNLPSEDWTVQLLRTSSKLKNQQMYTFSKRGSSLTVHFLVSSSWSYFQALYLLFFYTESFILV